MDWDFEDFLKKAEGKDEVKDNNGTPIIPIDSKNKPSIPKWFWMAASVVVLLSIGFIFNYNNKNIEDQAQLVENQIKLQKNNFIEENSEHQAQVAVNHVSDSVSGAKKDSVFQENTVAEKDYLDEILPKEEGLKKKESHDMFTTPLIEKLQKILQDIRILTLL